MPTPGKRGETSPPEPRKTLERVLSKAGLGSRTEARGWIHARRVSVNGRIIENPDHWVYFRRDRVALDGRPLEPARKRYLLLYKPCGYLTTYHDPAGRPTVYDLLAGVEQFVAPVGRLDLNTSGLLLLTNDTQLAEALTNPKRHVPKIYLVKTATRLSDDAEEQLRQGVLLDDGPARPAQLRRVRDSATKTFLEITLTEGRNRQVRRMIEAVGSRVLKLVRIQFGPLTLGQLPVGQFRELSPDEVRMLKQVTNVQGRAAGGLPHPGNLAVRKGSGDPRRHRS